MQIAVYTAAHAGKNPAVPGSKQTSQRINFALLLQNIFALSLRLRLTLKRVTNTNGRPETGTTLP
jgi:hypothetical protein